MIEKGHHHDHRVDIWSVGVLTFELLTGYAPFTPSDADQKDADQIEEETKFNIKVFFFIKSKNLLFLKNGKYLFPKDFPLLAKDFVSKILVKNMDNRLSLSQMRDHPWIQGYIYVFWKKIMLFFIENVDKKILKSSHKYEEELKNLKKDVNMVKLGKDELSSALAKTQDSFTTEEIYKYSRPDSVKIIISKNLFFLDCQ